MREKNSPVVITCAVEKARMADQARPFTLAFGPQAHAAMVSIARPLLVARLGAAEQLVARPIAGPYCG